MGLSQPLFIIIFIMFYFHDSEQLIVNTFSSSSNTNSTPNHNPLFLCHPDQSQALLQFKSNFTILKDASFFCDYPVQHSYPKTESWKEGTDCCSSWDGVTCDAETGRVTELDLSCSQLQGTFNSHNSLFSSCIAPHLRKLSLAGNEFRGSNISSQLFASTLGLTHLNLSSSWFTGTIPSEISHLSNLVSLDLSGNRGLELESDIVFKNLTQLRFLNLGGVSMSSLDPSSLMNLSSSLVSLHLSSCALDGKIPRNFLLLRPNLQQLDLSYSDHLAFSFPKSSSNWTSNLRVLVLSGAKWEGELPDSIKNLKYLEILKLSGCQFTGSVPAAIVP